MYVLYLFVLILLNAKHGTTKAKFTRLDTTKAKFKGVGTFFNNRFAYHVIPISAHHVIHTFAYHQCNCYYPKQTPC